MPAANFCVNLREFREIIVFQSPHKILRGAHDLLPLVSLTPRGKDLIVSAFRTHSGQMKRVFSELSPDELRGLEVTLKKVGKRAAALMEESWACI